MSWNEIDRATQIARFERALGRLIIAWNDVEFRLIWLLDMLLEQEDVRPLRIITAHMTAEAKILAIKACLSEIVETPETKLIEHACKYADCLRVWRNFYGHSVMGVYDTHNPGIQTTAYSMKARGKVVKRLMPVTEQDLVRVGGYCLTLVDFIGTLNVVIRHKGLDAETGKPLGLPEAPPLPQTWEDYLQAQRSSRPPPQSSRG